VWHSNKTLHVAIPQFPVELCQERYTQTPLQLEVDEYPTVLRAVKCVSECRFARRIQRAHTHVNRWCTRRVMPAMAFSGTPAGISQRVAHRLTSGKGRRRVALFEGLTTSPHACQSVVYSLSYPRIGLLRNPCSWNSTSTQPFDKR
jgi:hypothetical protein